MKSDRIATCFFVVFLLTFSACSTNKYNANSWLSEEAISVVEMNVDIVIDVPVEEAFSYASDISNDPYWREEVLTIESTDVELEQGSVVGETIFLGLTYGYHTEAIVAELRSPAIIAVRSSDEHNRYFYSRRIFEPLPDGSTRFTYHILADKRIVEDVAGAGFPANIAKFIFQSVMQRNLERLKDLLENSPPD